MSSNDLATQNRKDAKKHPVDILDDKYEFFMHRYDIKTRKNFNHSLLQSLLV